MHGGNGKVAYIDTEGTLYAFYFTFKKLLWTSSTHYESITYDCLFNWFSLTEVLCSFANTCSRPDRIVAIAERFGMDPGAVLDNVSFLCFIYVS